MAEKIGLTGVLCSVSCPSDEKLKITIDCSKLDNRTFMEFSEMLQDLMLAIDAAYSERARLMRSIDGKFTGRGGIMRNEFKVIGRNKEIKFSPVPNVFVNKVKNLKHVVYDEINYYAASKIVLVEAGRFKRCLYILSKSGASEYTRRVESVNREIENLNREIAEYLKSGEYKDLLKLIEDYGLDTKPLEKEFQVDKVRLQQIPIELASYVIEEWERKDPVVAKYIKEMREKIIKDAVETFRQKLKPYLKMLSSKRISEKTIKKIREDLIRIREMSVEVGLSAVADSVITPIVDVIDNPEKFKEVFKDEKKLSEEIDARFTSLLKRI